MKANQIKINYFNNFVYPNGSSIVIYDSKTKPQQIFNKHQCEVSCIAMHPKGVIFASATKLSIQNH